MSKVSDPMFDRNDGITKLEEDVLGLLEKAQQVQAQLDEQAETLRAMLTDALQTTMKPGDILQSRSRDWGVLRVMAGNARGARVFEVAEYPSIVEFSPGLPERTRFRVEAYPLTSTGQRLSGRAGNSRNRRSDAVILFGDLCGPLLLDDKRSANDMLLEFVSRAAQAQQGGQP